MSDPVAANKMICVPGVRFSTLFNPPVKLAFRSENASMLILLSAPRFVHRSSERLQNEIEMLLDLLDLE